MLLLLLYRLSVSAKNWDWVRICLLALHLWMYEWAGRVNVYILPATESLECVIVYLLSFDKISTIAIILNVTYVFYATVQILTPFQIYQFI